MYYYSRSVPVVHISKELVNIIYYILPLLKVHVSALSSWRCPGRCQLSVIEHWNTTCKFSSKTRPSTIRFVHLSIAITRMLTLNEIRIALIIAGIESNPGPDQVDESNNISNLEVITINCNGLTSDQRLLQAIGRIKKRITTIYFTRTELQTMHN